MQVLTTTLDTWTGDAWLVDLETAIRPVLTTYRERADGSLTPTAVAIPSTRHVVVERAPVPGGHSHETLVYPAFASGSPRQVADTPTPIAGGTGFTHCDALDDVDRRYDAVEADVDGERADGMDISVMSCRP